jgi:hypothetical protein
MIKTNPVLILFSYPNKAKTAELRTITKYAFGSKTVAKLSSKLL